jgi:hypothetical protein
VLHFEAGGADPDRELGNKQGERFQGRTWLPHSCKMFKAFFIVRYYTEWQTTSSNWILICDMIGTLSICHCDFAFSR